MRARAPLELKITLFQHKKYINLYKLEPYIDAPLSITPAVG